MPAEIVVELAHGLESDLLLLGDDPCRRPMRVVKFSRFSR